MRVISGKARGCHLHAPKGFGTRPTADRMKEALFSMLAADVPDADFLDLFSGTGSIGIEALSRGAQSALFVEHNRDCARVIQENLTRTKLDGLGQVICADVWEAMAAFGRKDVQFDIIFMDPPYAQGVASDTLLRIKRHSLLKKDGFVVVEQGRSAPLPEAEGFEIYKHKSYTTTAFIFLEATT